MFFHATIVIPTIETNVKGTTISFDSLQQRAIFFLLNIDKTVDDVLFQNKFYKLFVLCSLIEYYFLFFQTLHIKLITFI